jgi:hypothetical protein
MPNSIVQGSARIRTSVKDAPAKTDAGFGRRFRAPPASVGRLRFPDFALLREIDDRLVHRRRVTADLRQRLTRQDRAAITRRFRAVDKPCGVNRQHVAELAFEIVQLHFCTVETIGVLALSWCA